jgi:hypothetical protein
MEPQPFDEGRSEAFAARMADVLNRSRIAFMTSIGHQVALFDAIAGFPWSQASGSLRQINSLGTTYTSDSGRCLPVGSPTITPLPGLRALSRARGPADPGLWHQQSGAADAIYSHTGAGLPEQLRAGIEVEVTHCPYSYVCIPRMHHRDAREHICRMAQRASSLVRESTPFLLRTRCEAY